MGKRNTAVRIGNALPASMAARLGSSRTLKRIFRPLVTAAVPNGLVLVTVRSGAASGKTLQIDPKKEKYYWSGSYEPEVQRTLASSLAPGETFWDVGAHVGFFTLIASDLVGCTGSIHAFEPSEPNRNRLESTVRLNGLTNVTIYPMAISDTVGTTAFVTDLNSSMGRIGSGAPNTTSIVRTATLDHLFAQQGMPTLVKIDAEGLELRILSGAQHLIERRTSTFLIELHDSNDALALRDYFPGYSELLLDSSHLLFTPFKAPTR